MTDLKTIFGRGHVSVEQLGGGLDKLNFAVHSPEGFFIWQLSAAALAKERYRLLQKLAGHLWRQGIVTRRLVPGSLQALPQSKLRWSAVYFGVPGQTIPWSRYSLSQVKAAVKYLERIHRAGRSFPELAKLERIEGAWSKIPTAERNVLPRGYCINLAAWRRRAEALTCLSQDRRTATVLHGDYGRANIIFEGERVVGVVDFDQARMGHPAFDLGRFTSYLLLDTTLSGSAIYQSICQTYRLVSITMADLKLATEWAWWTDWLSWRHVPSDLRGKLKNKLVTSGIIESI